MEKRESRVAVIGVGSVSGDEEENEKGKKQPRDSEVLTTDAQKGATAIT